MNRMCIRVLYWIGMHRLEDWKIGRLEEWKVGRVEEW